MRKEKGRKRKRSAQPKIFPLIVRKLRKGVYDFNGIPGRYAIRRRVLRKDRAGADDKIFPDGDAGRLARARDGAAAFFPVDDTARPRSSWKSPLFPTGEISFPINVCIRAFVTFYRLRISSSVVFYPHAKNKRERTVRFFHTYYNKLFLICKILIFYDLL